MDLKQLSSDLTSILGLDAPPIGITFTDEPPADVPAFDAPMAPPAPDGRTGRVPAGCVFWMEGAKKTFSTTPDDHGNCSVGSLTHGLKGLEDIQGNADVAELLASGWVTMDMVPGIPTVSERPGAITYGPLDESPFDPDVVLMRLDGRQMMVLNDAVPEMDLGGKPQCHIVAVAKDQERVSASVGCALSRARTGMRPHEMTCAIPGPQLADVVKRLKETAKADKAVAAYAAQDKARFS